MPAYLATAITVGIYAAVTIGAFSVALWIWALWYIHGGQ